MYESSLHYKIICNRPGARSVPAAPAIKTIGKGRHALSGKRAVTDIELCRRLDPVAADHYSRAMDVMASYPDYALSKFRIVTERLVERIAEHFNLDLSGKGLFESINELLDCQLIDRSLCSALHEVRTAGNECVHGGDRQGSGDLKAATSIRKVLISALESVFLIINKGQLLPSVDPVEPRDTTSQEILWEAVTSLNFKSKMAAGLILEAQTLAPLDKRGLVLQLKEQAHQETTERMAAQLYWAACHLSANLDAYSYIELQSNGGKELWLFRRADCEALYRFSMLSYQAEGWGELQRLGLLALQSAATRKYPPACSAYGDYLRKQGRFHEALEFLTTALAEDDPHAFSGLALLYTDEGCPFKSKEQAEFFLCEGAKQGSDHCTFLLGSWLYDGDLLDRNEERGVKLVEQAAKAGHEGAAVYLRLRVDDSFQRTFQQGALGLLGVLESLKGTTPGPPPRKMRPNEKCYCNSGKKYKVCCRP